METEGGVPEEENEENPGNYVEFMNIQEPELQINFSYLLDIIQAMRLVSTPQKRKVKVFGFYKTSHIFMRYNWRRFKICDP